MGFQKGHAPVNTEKMVATRKARGNFKWSEEARKKASVSHTGTKKPWASANMSELMKSGKISKKNTSIELSMKYIVDTLLLPWILQYKIKTPTRYTLADIFIPSLNIVVYCDGCYWHGCSEHSKENRWYKREKDNALDLELQEMGYKVFRFWAHEFKDLNKIKNVFRKEMNLSLI